MRSIAEITNASSSEEGDDEDDSDGDGDGDDEDDEDGSEESGEESDEFEDQGSDSDASEEMERQQAEAEVRATQPVPTKCRWKDWMMMVSAHPKVAGCLALVVCSEYFPGPSVCRCLLALSWSNAPRSVSTNSFDRHSLLHDNIAHDTRHHPTHHTTPDEHGWLVHSTGAERLRI